MTPGHVYAVVLSTIDTAKTRKARRHAYPFCNPLLEGKIGPDLATCVKPGLDVLKRQAPESACVPHTCVLA